MEETFLPGVGRNSTGARKYLPPLVKLLLALVGLVVLDAIWIKVRCLCWN